MKVHCTFDELVPAGKLKPNPRNPNKHPPEQIVLLSKIIDHHGWRWPIIVSKRSGLIVGGHGRMEAALRLGQTDVPVSFQDFESDEDELAFMKTLTFPFECYEMAGRRF